MIRAIPLLPVWAFMQGYRVTFTFKIYDAICKKSVTSTNWHMLIVILNVTFMAFIYWKRPTEECTDFSQGCYLGSVNMPFAKAVTFFGSKSRPLYDMIGHDIHDTIDKIWYMIWYDTIRYDMIYDMIWYDMIWYDMIWYDMIWYDMIWYDMIWYDMIWYDIRYDIF